MTWLSVIAMSFLLVNPGSSPTHPVSQRQGLIYHFSSRSSLDSLSSDSFKMIVFLQCSRWNCTSIVGELYHEIQEWRTPRNHRDSQLLTRFTVVSNSADVPKGPKCC